MEKIERNLGHILGTIFDRTFSCCFQAKNCWDTLLSSGPSNVGGQDLVSELQ